MTIFAGNLLKRPTLPRLGWALNFKNWVWEYFSKPELGPGWVWFGFFFFFFQPASLLYTHL